MPNEDKYRRAKNGTRYYDLEPRQRLLGPNSQAEAAPDTISKIDRTSRELFLGNPDKIAVAIRRSHQKLDGRAQVVRIGTQT